MRAALVLISLGLAAPAAATEGFVQLGTGMGPLELPLESVIGGGGLRVGFEVGRIAVYAGGLSSRANLSVAFDRDEVTIGGRTWAAQGGLRLRVGGDELARPYLTGGALVMAFTGLSRNEYPHGEFSTEVALKPGPGGFLGGGADVKLAPAVDLGVEIGAVHTRTRVGFEERGDFRTYDEYHPIRATWLYSDLHVTVHWGRR